MANRLDFDKLKTMVTNVEYTIMGRQVMCQLTIYNGHHEAGIAGVIDMDNFDEALGKEAAYKKALDNLAAIGSFLVRERMFVEQMLDKLGADKEAGPLVRLVGYLPRQHLGFLQEKFGLYLAPFPDLSR